MHVKMFGINLCQASSFIVHSFSSAVWRGNPSVQRRPPTKTAPSARSLTFTAHSAILTAAAVPLPPPPRALQAWPRPALRAWPGCCEHATSLQVWPSASRKRRRTRGARPFQIAMNCQQICRIRR